VPKSSKLPDEVIQHWPEVLNDVDIEVVPLEYLDSVIVTFSDGKIWDIDTAKARQTQNVYDLEEALDEVFQQYEDDIVNVDFRLDVQKVKEDIQKRTKRFLKKR
jgi:hypothetical protein